MKLPLQHRIRNRLRSTWLREAVVSYRHRGLLPQDVFLASYPKSGTTWMAFMLAQLLWKAGREQRINDNRFLPAIGQQSSAERTLPDGGRLVRTHERYRSCYRKAVYVVRDGRDAATSMYYQVQRVMGMQATFSEFLPIYLRGRLTGAGAWHDHVNQWRDAPRFAGGSLLVVRYEDMKSDVANELRRTAEFLGVEATEAEIVDAIEAGSMNAMKGVEQRSEGVKHNEQNGSIPVVRKGVVGDWRNHFSEEDLVEFYRYSATAMEKCGYPSSTDAAHYAQID
ncbi:MAG: sulfotransferase domain-containing protein [Pirellulales bacterium]|nr:sulfotransferase domain-containing protein [Pirellulales bacterium]